MRTVDSAGRRETGRRRARLAALAVAASLVAVVALGSGGGALAAPHQSHQSIQSHHKHPAHPTHSPSVAAAPAFALDFTCAEAWNQVVGVVCVQTVPGAALSIKVTTCRRTVIDPNLAGIVQANTKGQYAWTWTPHTTCTVAKATVTAKSGGKTVTRSTTFAITPEHNV